MATLRVTSCRVNTTSITISFSEKVDPSSDATGAANSSLYTVSVPAAGFSGPPSSPGWNLSMVDDRTVAITAPPNTFNPGDWVMIKVSGVGLESDTTQTVTETVSRQVPSEAARATRDVEDAISYPLLTEEIGYRPSPVGGPTGGGGGGSLPSAGGGTNLGQVALRAVGDVLGWKPNTDDPKGFIGALTQSFSLTDVEGHVESKWMPRTYAVQTDLGGGITGAQASLYTRAKDALDQSLSLLDGLYPLDPEADPEYVKALREMARSQMSQIVKEFGMVGLPSILRIDTYFEILLGQHPTRHFARVEFDPDKIKGTLGELRDTYGIYFRGNPFNNSVEDEQDITNFRVISDYMTSLLQSWISNREFFIVQPNQLAFFGTQLVLISRQLNVIAETVNEVRFTLDSVFIGPNERQSLLFIFKDRSLPPMFLEDMLVEIENFVTNEGPQLLRDGGKISVTNNILPVVRSLKNLVIQAHDPANKDKVPDGFRTARVRRSLDDLRDQLGELIRLTEQVEQQVPLAEDKLAISGISAPVPDNEDPPKWVFSVYGSAFDPAIEAFAHSLVAERAPIEFYSAERIDVTVDPSGYGWAQNSSHDITITNSDGESATLLGALNWDGTTLTAAPKYTAPAANTAVAPRPAFRAAAKSRSVVIETGTGEAAPTAPAAPAAVAAAPAPAAPAPPAVTQDQIAALQNQIDELKASHESGIQKLADKMTELFGGKNKDKEKKSKDDD